MANVRNAQSGREVQYRITEQDTIDSVGTGKTHYPIPTTARGAFGLQYTKQRPQNQSTTGNLHGDKTRAQRLRQISPHI